MLSVLLLLLSAGFATTSTVFRKRIDEDGNIMFAPNGRPLVEVDEWASFWNGWPSNLPAVAAIGFLLLGFLLLLFGSPFRKDQSK
jgi:hypothetical protein